MLDISRFEKCLILMLLVVGIFFTQFSYYKKVGLYPAMKIINIDEAYTLVDINTADAMQFERLPGVGPVLAANIIAYREEIGKFGRLEEIKNVKGIGDKKFEKIKTMISIGD